MKQYKVEKSWGEYDINGLVERYALQGWKPLFITPIVFFPPQPENLGGGGGNNVNPIINFLVTFEKESQ